MGEAGIVDATIINSTGDVREFSTGVCRHLCKGIDIQEIEQRAFARI